MLSLFRDLFVNWTIIVSFLTFGNLVMRERFPRLTSKSRALIAIFSGIVGCLLMLYGIKIAPSIIIDFRIIPIMIMGIYYTPAATMITAVIIGVFRISFMGLNNSSVFGFAIAIIMGVFCGFIGKSKINIGMKWALSMLIACIAFDFAFTILISDHILLLTVLIAYSLSFLTVSGLTYILIKYLNRSNQNYIQLQSASSIDFLTGLSNVKCFYDSLNFSLNYAKENSKCIALLFIDIDFFKRINDSYGHSNGDLALKEISDILTKYSRDIDVVSRIGGEEFTVILTDCELTDAILIAERMRNAISQHAITLDDGRIIKTTVSIGVSCYPQTASDMDSLLRQADSALYEAKKSGRNGVHVYNFTSSNR